MNPQNVKFQKVNDDLTNRDNSIDSKQYLGDSKQYQAVEMINMDPAIETTHNEVKIDDQHFLQKKAPIHALDYRPEIDGIRAIAISLVLIYHAWPHVIPGGFIGVDVFFVISGYLISSIIYKEIAKGSFSFVKFYYRRIRRLFPALLIVMTTVLLLGMKNYLPEMLGYLLKTLIASALFGANIHFYTLGNDYFRDDTSLNSLLHFWSLGVEEQFYIFWPCIAMIVVKMSVKKSTIFILLAFLGSFILSVVTTYKASKFAFYFPLSRFWQLLIGCSLAYYNFIQTTKIKQVNNTHPTKIMKVLKALAVNTLSLLGITLIILCAFLIDSKSAFPGFWAIMPSMGSALIIFCEDKAYFNKYVMSNRILVFIGKISYPLYLWHWPLLVFAKTIFMRCSQTNIWASPGAMIMLSVILSVLTYLFVENNVRKSKGNRIVYILGSLMVLLLVVCTIALHNIDSFSFLKYLQKKGFNYDGNYEKPPFVQRKSISSPTGLEPTSVEKLKYSPGLEDYWDSTAVYWTSPDSRVFNDGRAKKVVFIGDSHAEMAIYRAHHLLRVVGAENFPTVILNINFGSSFIFPCIHEHSSPADCKRSYDFIKDVKPYSVFIASYYDAYINSDYEEEDELHDQIVCCHVLFSCSCQSKKDGEHLFTEFSKTLKELTSIGIKVFVAALKPEGKEFNPKFMYDENGVIDERIKPVKLSEFIKKKSYLYNRLNQAIIEGGATIIDYSENLCYEDLCQVVDPYGKPVYKEESHFQNYVVRDYLDVLDQVFGL